ncbi:hypothetical protein CAPTEDRAFT_229281 [Capitella teleta]|uniref:CAP-Gly domain-containing protein n=1 Tax=Capitella teleta TaxID=283909 RepID=R7V432_CAPTE|nr:hypothetical protein CAPTEDRAFT_229281 [Capitella teleta]|eukprot:ELU13319.1 hypothetical protein CAPTEDRAFT_229281 [Capitella teleta]
MLPENSSQLQSLVVDKELAARAVAFVVSSSRKGIVPLCADVANLLKAKSRLEHKVSRLRRENEALRSSVSLHTSNCTSPLPTSAYSDHSSCSYGGHHHTGKCSPTYSSSQCSSLAGSSPKLDKFAFPPAPLPPFSFPPLPSSDQSVMSEGSDDALVQRHELYKRHERKNSLPEMIAHPHDGIPKVCPRGQSISAEVQCSLGPADGESTQQINLTLRRDLTNAQQEIAELRQKLLSIELKQKALDECYVENECAKNRNAPSEIARLCSPTFILPPLEGCKCRACEGANCDAALKGGFSCDQTLLCARIQIEVNDTVRLVDGREGRVCYLGHVDKLGSANAIFLGMESTNPESTHDGVHLGERYFTCKHNSGLFAPVEDVDLIISYRTGKPISRSLSSREERRKTQRKSSFCLSKAAAMETNEVV